MTTTQNTSAITFTKVFGKWVVTGPDTIIVKGATVTVTKSNGNTSRVYITKIDPTKIKAPGTMIGFFTDADEHEAEVAAADTFEADEEARLAATAARCAAIEAEVEARNTPATEAVESDEEAAPVIAKINAQFVNLTTTDDGDFITGNSVAIISTIDADGDYTEVRQIKLSELAADNGDFDNFRDDVIEALAVIAASMAAENGQTIIDTDGDEQVFWTVSASK